MNRLKVNDSSDDNEKIELIALVGECLYSVKYGNNECEYDRFFDLHNHADYIHSFFEENKDYFKRPAWEKIKNIESATRQVLHEAYELENRLIEYAENTEKGVTPDLENLFKFIGGDEFADVYEFCPMKAYGTGRPSFLRLYAIKLEVNKFVITGGGIKLHDSIQSSPGIKDHVLQDIRRVRDWLMNSKILY